MKLLVKLCIKLNENSFGLVAEAYGRLTRQCWSVYCYKLLISMVTYNEVYMVNLGQI